jgi:hypothetical protein
MAETKRTCEQVVGYLLEGEGLDSLSSASASPRLHRLLVGSKKPVHAAVR